MARMPPYFCSPSLLISWKKEIGAPWGQKSSFKSIRITFYITTQDIHPETHNWNKFHKTILTLPIGWNMLIFSVLSYFNLKSQNEELNRLDKSRLGLDGWLENQELIKSSPSSCNALEFPRVPVYLLFPLLWGKKVLWTDGQRYFCLSFSALCRERRRI